VKPSALPEMEARFDELPNFADVLEDIRKHLALCVDSNDSIELPPMLLLGEPGIGKTHFARKLAELLGTGFGFVPMSSLTAGWVLSGASSQWKNAKPGKVFDTFLNGDYANPVIVVDELDKAAADGQYEPLGALYELLEVDTATRFVDEFVELPIDASGAVWLATANDAARIPEPVLNRMAVYEIDAPDEAGARRIAQTIYSEIRNGHDWGRRFPEMPSDATLDKLASMAPREMRRAIQSAFGTAKLAGRTDMQPDDVQVARGGRRQKIGF
jgi:ATP-dependent Lon protease